MKLVAACSQCHSQYDASQLHVGETFQCRCGAMVTVQEPRVATAAVICCSNCGAPRGASTNRCEYCGATYTAADRDLDGVCPTCLSRVSSRCKFCSYCGSEINLEQVPSQTSAWDCPACGNDNRLESLNIQTWHVLQCLSCCGIWLGQKMLEAMITQQQVTATNLQRLTQNRVTPPPAAANGKARHYRPCPECHQLMLQQRYGQTGGVIVDICREHGVWLDQGELSQILRIVQTGGTVGPPSYESIQQARADAQRQRIGNTEIRFQDDHYHGRSALSLFDGIVRFLSGL